MFIAILTLLSALSISGVAIFYSVIGLATIFPGAFVPVVIMGSVLEVGKLIAASWLYRNWKHTRFLLKTYLTVAVVVLSLITSMGIFGFLSKAHLEQNLASENLTQRIELINSKITSQETYIIRQNAVIERAEKSLTRTTGSNTEAIEIEKQSLKDVQDKFKTLLVVETNTIKNLNDRLKILDKDVSDVLTAKKSFFNEEKAAADLKASQKEEREAIQTNTSEAQSRIAVLKDDYANDTALIQKRIDKLREGTVDDKSGVNTQIESAEDNIINSQNTIDDLIIERGPLETSMIKLEAEVGPIKYIAALVVDWGVTDDVELNEAVRWVILLIIVVFDPLAVALLLAANQSLLRRFPSEAPKPQQIVDLEKPDEEDVTLKWNEMMDKSNAATHMEKATAQLKEWKEKLDAFNTKLPKPNAEVPVEIIQQDDSVPHIDLKGQKKTEQEEIVVDKELQEMKFEQRIKDEAAELERISKEAKEEEEYLAHEQALADYAESFKEKDGFDEDEVAYDMTPEPAKEEPTIAEQIEKVMEPKRIRPDFTEVIETEQAVQEMMENPKKAIEEDLRIEHEIARKSPLADMNEIAIEPEIGAFTSGYKPAFVKKSQEKINKDAYVQNEEQTGNTSWKKIKTRLTSEDQYHKMQEKRIDKLMSSLEAGEIQLEDLTQEDRQVIIDIRMQNESGDNLT